MFGRPDDPMTQQLIQGMVASGNPAAMAMSPDAVRQAYGDRATTAPASGGDVVSSILQWLGGGMMQRGGVGAPGFPPRAAAAAAAAPKAAQAAGEAVAAGSKGLAPVRWGGWQFRLRGEPDANWHMTEEVAGITKGSTRTAKSLEAMGFEVPKPPHGPGPTPAWAYGGSNPMVKPTPKAAP